MSSLCKNIDKSFLPAGHVWSVRTAGPKIALHFLSVCLCIRTYHVRNITSNVTMQLLVY